MEVGVQLLARVGGGRTKTKLMLNSTQVEVEVEVGVELGKNGCMTCMSKTSLSIRCLYRTKVSRVSVSITKRRPTTIC